MLYGGVPFVYMEGGARMGSPYVVLTLELGCLRLRMCGRRVDAARVVVGERAGDLIAALSFGVSIVVFL